MALRCGSGSDATCVRVVQLCLGPGSCVYESYMLLSFLSSWLLFLSLCSRPKAFPGRVVAAAAGHSCKESWRTESNIRSDQTLFMATLSPQLLEKQSVRHPGPSDPISP